MEPNQLLELRSVDDVRVAVVALGCVGLPTALSFADQEAEAIGLDGDEGRLAAIKDNRAKLLPRDRPRLAHAQQKPVLRLATEPSALADPDAVVLCVPTPIDAHQAPGLTALSAACASEANHARVGQTIVSTSTAYVGCIRDRRGRRQRGHSTFIGGKTSSTRQTRQTATTR